MATSLYLLLLFKNVYFFHSALRFLMLLRIHLILKETKSNIPSLVMMFAELFGFIAISFMVLCGRP